MPDYPVPNLRALVERSEGGDREALAELRRLTLERPGTTQSVIDLLPTALDRWIDRRAGTSPVARLAVEAVVDRLRTDLRGDAPTGLEMLLVDRVIVCWLALECAELGYLERTAREYARSEEVHWLGRVDGCQRRLLAAVRTLAVARKMAAPEILDRLPHRRVAGELM